MCRVAVPRSISRSRSSIGGEGSRPDRWPSLRWRPAAGWWGHSTVVAAEVAGGARSRDGGRGKKARRGLGSHGEHGRGWLRRPSARNCLLPPRSHWLHSLARKLTSPFSLSLSPLSSPLLSSPLGIIPRLAFSNCVPPFFFNSPASRARSESRQKIAASSALFRNRFSASFPTFRSPWLLLVYDSRRGPGAMAGFWLCLEFHCLSTDSFFGIVDFLGWMIKNRFEFEVLGFLVGGCKRIFHFWFVLL